MAKNDYLEQEEIRGYQWPASALTGEEMEILASWKEKTGTPISHLLKQSILKCQELIKKN
jgi:hypothetical protein